MSKQRKTTTPQNLYMLSVRMYEGADWVDDRFVFHATDDKQAEDKRFGWARYQGVHGRDTVVIRPITADELHSPDWIHDEWVS
jgi:hypothetical protein